MLTSRDKKVIIAVGNFGILSQPQIQKIIFPSKSGYQICQRRFRQELVSNGYLSQPFYIDVNINGSRIPLYKLKTKGKKLYETLTGKEHRIPRWNYNKLHHRLETNNVIADLQLARLVRDFNIEYQPHKNAPIIMDAYLTLTNERRKIKMAVEIDYSGVEPKQEIQKQYKEYEKYFIENGEPEILLFYSNRAQKLYNWIEEVADSDLVSETNFTPYFITRDKGQLKEFINDIKKM